MSWFVIRRSTQLVDSNQLSTNQLDSIELIRIKCWVERWVDSWIKSESNPNQIRIKSESNPNQIRNKSKSNPNQIRIKSESNFKNESEYAKSKEKFRIYVNFCLFLLLTLRSNRCHLMSENFEKQLLLHINTL